jgi:hypothetical protein
MDYGDAVVARALQAASAREHAGAPAVILSRAERCAARG